MVPYENRAAIPCPFYTIRSLLMLGRWAAAHFMASAGHGSPGGGRVLGKSCPKKQVVDWPNTCVVVKWEMYMGHFDELVGNKVPIDRYTCNFDGEKVFIQYKTKFYVYFSGTSYTNGVYEIIIPRVGYFIITIDIRYQARAWIKKWLLSCFPIQSTVRTVTFYTAVHWHALIDCYGQHRRTQQ